LAVLESKEDADYLIKKLRDMEGNWEQSTIDKKWHEIYRVHTLNE